MGTTAIPLTTLSVGSHEYGPANMNPNETLVNLSIDRTVAGGFNEAPASTVALIYIWLSTDGGNTWLWVAGDQMTGGTYTSPKTGLEVTDYVELDMPTGPGKRVKAVITVFGAAVAMAGSLTTS